jgi:transposase
MIGGHEVECGKNLTLFIHEASAMNAHPLALRRRLFNYNLSHSVRNTAKLFGVSPDTVQRLKQLLIETGDLAPRPCHAEHAQAVSPEGELYVQALWVEQPDLSLAELREAYERAYGVAVGTTTLHHLLQRLGYSRKKHSTTPNKAALRTRPKKTAISTR